jgi:hypothetical protein
MSFEWKRQKRLAGTWQTKARYLFWKIEWKVVGWHLLTVLLGCLFYGVAIVKNCIIFYVITIRQSIPSMGSCVKLKWLGSGPDSYVLVSSWETAQLARAQINLRSPPRCSLLLLYVWQDRFAEHCPTCISLERKASTYIICKTHPKLTQPHRFIFQQTIRKHQQYSKLSSMPQTIVTHGKD